MGAVFLGSSYVDVRDDTYTYIFRFSQLGSNFIDMSLIRGNIEVNAEHHESGWRDADEMILEIHACENWNQLASCVSSRLMSFFNLVDFMWVEYAANWDRVLWASSVRPEHERPIRGVMRSLVKKSSQSAGYWRDVGEAALEKSDGVFAMRDYYSDEEIEALPVYQSYMEPLGILEALCFQCYYSERGGSVVGFALLDCKEMSSREFALLKLVRDHIRLAGVRLSRQSSLANMAGLLNEVRGSSSTTGIAVLGATGKKLWEADDKAWARISALGGYRDSEKELRLPERLIAWVSKTIQESSRVVARRERFKEVFRSFEGKGVEVTLILEGVGFGAVLVLCESDELDSRAAEGEAGPTCSKREVEVLNGLCAGLTNNEIALGLGISKRTADKHVENIFQKLGVRTRAGAIARYDEGVSV